MFQYLVGMVILFVVIFLSYCYYIAADGFYTTWCIQRHPRWLGITIIVLFPFMITVVPYYLGGLFV